MMCVLGEDSTIIRKFDNWLNGKRLDILRGGNFGAQWLRHYQCAMPTPEQTLLI
jgi:hypothetical protein